MLIQIWRFVTILLVALLMGLAFAHVLERPAKMQYDAQLYITLQKTPDWMMWRAKWETGHAIRFGLQLSALGLLVLSVLFERRESSVDSA